MHGGLTLRVNGVQRRTEAAGTTALIHVLREDFGLVGTRWGCGEGACGACRVLVDGRLQSACDLPVEAAAGRDVTTAEGVAPALVDAFIAEQAAQCGYCSSGMLIAASALLAQSPAPSHADICSALDAQLCRCGAHPRIVRAVLRAAASLSDASLVNAMGAGSMAPNANPPATGASRGA